MQNTMVKKSNLIIPVGAVELSKDEMQYVDGGGFLNGKLDISNNVVQSIVGTVLTGAWFAGVGVGTAILTGVVSSSTVVGMVAASIGWVSALLALIPGLQILAMYVLTQAVNFAMSLVSAVVKGKGVRIELFLGIPTGSYAL